MTHTFLNRPQRALSVIGLWFQPEIHKFPYLVYRAFLLFIQYSFLVFNIVYMGMIWGDLVKVSEGSYLLFTQATLCLKVTTFLMNHNRLRQLFDFMESDIFATQTRGQESILSVHSLRMWKLYASFLTCGMINCTEWAVVPLLENHSPRVFPFQIWMPADPAKSPDYLIGYLYQAFAAYSSAIICMTIDFLTVSLIMFASAQLEVIADKVQEAQPLPYTCNSGIDIGDRKEVVKSNNRILNECIKQHQAVIRFVGLVEDMFNVNIFFQMCGTVAIICIIGFQITIEPPNSFHFISTVNYLVTILVQLYLYCWCGNELTQYSINLRDALYKTPWYEQDANFRRTLFIAMECMKRPIIFRTGYYIPLSRPIFVSILRCSYSYFAFLNQANNQ